MKENGLSKVEHISYTIENYITKIPFTFDRVYKLINHMLYLGLPDNGIYYKPLLKKLNENQNLINKENVIRKFEVINNLLEEYR